MSRRRIAGLEPMRRLVIPLLLCLLGLGLIVCRFAFGLGAATNLSDGYPWGVWVGIDILVGIALAAGGFVMAGLARVLGGQRNHGLSRPAILTATPGYLRRPASLRRAACVADCRMGEAPCARPKTRD
ncbi:MAG: hypothetical protein AMS21_10285 [Gemmatimonas sp. SG8_38_2]|nr:MAG: hypothetical protein AMS21_10285 [Gemmatimonas sp. SG8_38_2]